MRLLQRISKFLQSPLFPQKAGTLDLSISWGRLDALRKRHGRWSMLWCMCQAMERQGLSPRLIKRCATNKSTGTRLHDFRLRGCGLECDSSELDRALVVAVAAIERSAVDDVTLSDEPCAWRDFPELEPRAGCDYNSLIDEVHQIMLPDLERGLLQISTPAIDEPGDLSSQAEIAGSVARRRL